MSKKETRIIVKRVSGGGGGHHGGAWKIAFADFMTAMMAFFMVMWLLSQASPLQRAGIAEYFRTPLKVAITGGSSSSVIPGGGPDPTRLNGGIRQVSGNGEGDGEGDAYGVEDASRLENVKERLNDLIEKSPALQQFRSQLQVDITIQGLRLQILDDEKRPMFDLASSKLEPHMRSILREIGPTINELPNKIILSGHTDATHYTNGERSYSNWELSADRANASRRELIAGGMAEQRVMRVVGAADTNPLDRVNPRNPINRRISLLVLNQRTQEQIEKENNRESRNEKTSAASIASPAASTPKTVSGKQPVAAH